MVQTLLMGAFFMGSLPLLYLFFRKRRAFPRLAIGFLAASVVVRHQASCSAVTAAIWIAYFVRSRRVAATFVT